MSKKKKVSVIVFITTLAVLVACSKPSDESSSNKASKNEEPASLSQSDVEPNEAEDTDQKDESSTNNNKPESAETEEGPTTNAPSNDISKASDLDRFLNEHYGIDNVHFKTKSWGKIEGTGRTGYRVDILPDTEEVGQEINAVFEKGTPYEDDRTAVMMDTASNILTDLPDLHKAVHIDSVNWVSYDGEFQVMLIQDYEKSTIKGGSSSSADPTEAQGETAAEDVETYISSGDEAVQLLKRNLKEGADDDVSFGTNGRLETDQTGPYYTVQLVSISTRVSGKTGTLGYYKVYQDGTYKDFFD
jgi:hypothetical protein